VLGFQEGSVFIEKERPRVYWKRKGKKGKKERKRQSSKCNTRKGIHGEEKEARHYRPDVGMQVPTARKCMLDVDM
jgi:hypothetical protein